MEIDKKNQRLIERFGRTYSGGEMIFTEDDEAMEVFMIVQGRVRLIKKVRLVERDIVVLKTGDMFGETALLRGSRQPCSAVSLGDCQVIAFEAMQFDDLMRDQPDVAIKLIGQLIRRLHSAEERIENMMLRDAHSKIVNTLIKLAQAASNDEGRVLLNISPIELSSRIGLDVDSVKHGILHLRENKYLRIVDEKIEIFDIDALRKVYNLMGMKEELSKS